MGSAQSGLPTLFICKCHACSALYIIPHALNWTQFNILHKNAHFGHKHSTTDYHYILDFLKKSAKNAMVVMFLKCLQLKMHTEIFNGKNDRMSGMCFKFFQKEKKKKYLCVWGRRNETTDNCGSGWVFLFLCKFLCKFYSRKVKTNDTLHPQCKPRHGTEARLSMMSDVATTLRSKDVLLSLAPWMAPAHVCTHHGLQRCESHFKRKTTFLNMGHETAWLLLGFRTKKSYQNHWLICKSWYFVPTVCRDPAVGFHTITPFHLPAQFCKEGIIIPT